VQCDAIGEKKKRGILRSLPAEERKRKKYGISAEQRSQTADDLSFGKEGLSYLSALLTESEKGGREGSSLRSCHLSISGEKEKRKKNLILLRGGGGRKKMGQANGLLFLSREEKGFSLEKKCILRSSYSS